MRWDKGQGQCLHLVHFRGYHHLLPGCICLIGLLIVSPMSLLLLSLTRPRLHLGVKKLCERGRKRKGGYKYLTHVSLSNMMKDDTIFVPGLLMPAVNDALMQVL